MTELARGSIADRPWGKTLGTLALRGLTGQLVLAADGKQYGIAFQQGIVVAAWSPLQADAAVRLALTGGLVSSTQVAEISRRTAADPHRDEIDIIAELIRLAPDQALRLRRRSVAQRAARTFSVDRGEFVVDDRITLPVVPGCELDIRSVIYIGARQLLSEQRLDDEIHQFGAWFRLRREILRDLPQFGFTDGERPVLDKLLQGAWLEELDGLGVEPRTTRAMVYALASCNGCEATPGDGSPRPQPPRATTPPAGTRPASQSTPAMRPPGSQSTPGMRPASPASGMAPVSDPRTQSSPSVRAPAPDPRTQSSSGMRVSSPTPPTAMTTGSGSAPGMKPLNRPSVATPSAGVRQVAPSQPPVDAPTDRRPQRMRGREATPPATPVARPGPELDAPTTRRTPVPEPARKQAPSQGPSLLQRKTKNSATVAAEIRSLIAQRIAIIDGHGDHFKLLGVTMDASDNDIRKAYFALARQLHPDRLASLDIEDDQRQAQRLFAQVNTAFATLSDPQKRADYADIQRRGGEAAIRAEQAKAEAAMQRALEAEEAFQRGELALARNQVPAAIQEFQKAISLDPDAGDYHAMLAWAQFCGAADKNAAAAGARRGMEKGIEKSPQSVTPRFLLGRVERMVGRDQEALRHFRSVLQLEPRHTEAQGEVRAIQARLGKR